jgi:hypothetical protein
MKHSKCQQQSLLKEWMDSNRGLCNMGGTYKHMRDNIINRENKTSYNI